MHTRGFDGRFCGESHSHAPKGSRRREPAHRLPGRVERGGSIFGPRSMSPLCPSGGQCPGHTLTHPEPQLPSAGPSPVLTPHHQQDAPLGRGEGRSGLPGPPGPHTHRCVQGACLPEASFCGGRRYPRLVKAQSHPATHAPREPPCWGQAPLRSEPGGQRPGDFDANTLTEVLVSQSNNNKKKIQQEQVALSQEHRAASPFEQQTGGPPPATV